MARLRGSRPGRVTAIRSRRLTSWEFGPGGTSETAFTTSSSAFLGSAVSLVAGVGKVTVVRTRGSFLAYLNTASALNDGYSGAIGIGIASLAAISAGIASVPTPLTEMDSDNWLFHQHFHVHAAGAIGGARTDST